MKNNSCSREINMITNRYREYEAQFSFNYLNFCNIYAYNFPKIPSTTANILLSESFFFVPWIMFFISYHNIFSSVQWVSFVHKTNEDLKWSCVLLMWKNSIFIHCVSLCYTITVSFSYVYNVCVCVFKKYFPTVIQ